MKLKIKLLEWSAGLPVAMMNSKTAEKIGVHAKDRVSIIFSDDKKISTILDILQGVVLFPGIPPIQCLSTTFLFLKSKVFPVCKIAFIKNCVSSKSIPN